MIFSGSEQRSRAGMASATITFDNSDGWLPIDFTEVSITRRAYRDGGNEYLLNGQRVRLKDISELLAQSGLAERTYHHYWAGVGRCSVISTTRGTQTLFRGGCGNRTVPHQARGIHQPAGCHATQPGACPGYPQ